MTAHPTLGVHNGRLGGDCRDNGVSGLMCPGVSGPEGSLDD